MNTVKRNGGKKMSKNLIPKIAKLLSINSAFVALVMGKDEIVKLPWKPKKGEDYYTFSGSDDIWRVSRQHWTCHPFDLAVLDKGWVYRTKEEAEAALPKVAAEMGVDYEL